MINYRHLYEQSQYQNPIPFLSKSPSIQSKYFMSTNILSSKTQSFNNTRQIKQPKNINQIINNNHQKIDYNLLTVESNILDVQDKQQKVIILMLQNQKLRNTIQKLKIDNNQSENYLQYDDMQKLEKKCKDLEIKNQKLQKQREQIFKRIVDVEREMNIETRRKQEKLQQTYKRLKSMHQENLILLQQQNNFKIQYQQLEQKYRNEIAEYRSQIIIIKNDQKMNEQILNKKQKELEIKIYEEVRKELLSKQIDEQKHIRDQIQILSKNHQFQINKKEEEIRQLNHKLTKLNSEIIGKNNLEKQQQQYLKKIDKQNKQLLDNLRKVEGANKSKDKILQEQRNGLEQIIQQKQKELIQMNKRFQGFFNQKEVEFISEKNNLINNLKKLNSEKQKNIEQLKKVNLENRNYRQKLQTTLQQIQSIKNKNSQTHRLLQREKRQILDSSKCLQSQKKQIQADFEQLKKQYEIILQQNHNKQMQISIMQNHLQHLKEQYNNVYALHNTTQQQLKSAINKHRSLESQYDQLNYEKQKIVSNLNQIKYENDMLKIKLKKFQQELASSAGKSSNNIKMEVENKKLKEELESMYTTLIIYQDKIKAYGKELIKQKQIIKRQNINLQLENQQPLNKNANKNLDIQYNRVETEMNHVIDYNNNQVNHKINNHNIENHQYETFTGSQRNRKSEKNLISPLNQRTDLNNNNFKKSLERQSLKQNPRYSLQKDQIPSTKTNLYRPSSPYHNNINIQNRENKDPYLNFDHNNQILKTKLSQKHFTNSNYKSKLMQNNNSYQNQVPPKSMLYENNSNSNSNNTQKISKQRLNENILKRCQMIINTNKF